MQSGVKVKKLMSVQEFADFVNLSTTTVYAAVYGDRIVTRLETGRIKICVADGLRWVETLSPKARARQVGQRRRLQDERYIGGALPGMD